jgi:ABC-type nitrate/sulfonate/bicarbonate transport system permease component
VAAVSSPAPTASAVAPALGATHRRASAIAWGAARGLSIALLLVLWEVVARSGIMPAFMLPPLTVTLDQLLQDVATGELFVNLGISFYRALVGFAIAGVGGIAIGMMIVRSAVARWFFDPIVSVGFPTPKVAFLPIFILWFGVYDMSKITMVAVDAIFPVLTATVIGLQGVERELLWSARNMGASERRLLWDIMLPAALPQILTGLQVALPIALIVEIATEMIMGGTGIGGAMLQSSRMFESPKVFAGIIEISLAGYCLMKGMALLRRRLLLWHQETAQRSGI